jgi:hypothetical protein
VVAHPVDSVRHPTERRVRQIVDFMGVVRILKGFSAPTAN